MFGTQDLALFVVSGLLLNIAPGPDSLLIMARSGGAVSAQGVNLALTEVQQQAVGACNAAELTYGLRPENVTLGEAGLPGRLRIIESRYRDLERENAQGQFPCIRRIDAEVVGASLQGGQGRGVVRPPHAGPTARYLSPWVAGGSSSRRSAFFAPAAGRSAA